jgi:predicted nuclease with RNAse H fold
LMIIGIDYGSKLAGTTVVSIYNPSSYQVRQFQSEKGKDADKFVLEQVKSGDQKVSIFIDAPLSLPKVYSHKSLVTDEYFYRACDKELKAMSPMFLGGLTARAIKLTRSLESLGAQVFETYPGALAKELELIKHSYKKEKENISLVLDQLLATFPVQLKESPQNWHQVDSLLAVISGIRHTNNEAQRIGDPLEGVIVF